MSRGARVLMTLFVAISLTTGPMSIGVAEGNVEQRIAEFWKRIDALQPGDYVSVADLGQWARNVIERNPRSRTTVADFRLSTAEMQSGIVRAGLAPAPPTAPAPATGNVEQRIAQFWTRVNALQPGDFLSAADLGQWALNIVERNPRARTTVADFRLSTAGMQGGMERAGLAPVAATPTPTPTRTPIAPGTAATLTSITPASGSNAGGTAFTLAGTGFVCTPTFPTVSFGTTAATITSCGATSITGTTPAGAVGATTVTVTIVGALASNSVAFTFTGTTAPIPTPIPTPTPTPPINAPATVTVGGLTFTKTVVGQLENYIETSISTSDAQSIRATFDADVARVQQDYQMTFGVGSKSYTFASTISYRMGLRTILGMSATGAAEAAVDSKGIYFSASNAIGLYWPAVRGDRPVRTIRHELTHMAIAQLARAQFVPNWFHEGSARLSEFTIPGTDWWRVRHRYLGASMALTYRLPRLSVLERSWSSLTVDESYVGGYQVTQLIRDEIGLAGTVALLRLVGQGQPFEQAYAAISGLSFDSLRTSLYARIQAGGLPRPGIASASDTPTGPGLYLGFYGLVPGTTVTVDLSGPGGTDRLSATVGNYGYLGTYYGPGEITAGAYSVTLYATNGTTSRTVVAAVAAQAWSDMIDPNPAPVLAGSGTLDDAEYARQRE